MKKKLVSLVLALSLAIGAFGGCSLITVNNKRDMKQVIATVQTSGDDGTYFDNIYKKDLVSYFNSVGSQYVQQGYSYSQTFDALLDQLINNKIFIHEARRFFSRKNNTLTVDSNLKDFLEEWEQDKAEYIVDISVNNLLDNFEQSVIYDLKLNAEAKEGYTDKPGYSGEPRAVISKAEKKAPEVTEENYKDADIKNYFKLYLIEKSTVIGSTDITRKKAYDKMVKAIDYYNLLGNPTFSEFKQSDFYKDELKRQMEGILISKYIDAIKSQVVAEGDENENSAKIVLSYQDLKDRYNAKFQAEKEKYSASVTEYKAALDALTEDNYILYNPTFDKPYGFVHNILIPFDEIINFEIGLIKPEDSQDDYYKKQMNAIIAKGGSPSDIKVFGSEQRASWITAGYEYEEIDGKIYFESTLYEGEIKDGYKGVAFNGTVSEVLGTNKKGDQVNAVTEDFEKVYDIELTKKIPFDTIYNEFIEALGGESKVSYIGENGTNKQNQYNNFKNSGDAILYSGKTNADNLDDIRGRVRDLAFAYSTDPGSLGGYLGYAVPNDSFVKEFSEAAEFALSQGEGGFAVVVTNYGLHIIYCSKIMVPDGDDASAQYFLPDFEIFKEELKDKDSFSYKFVDLYLNTMRNDYYNRHEEAIVNKYNNEINIKKYEKKYKDLLVD